MAGIALAQLIFGLGSVGETASRFTIPGNVEQSRLNQLRREVHQPRTHRSAFAGSDPRPSVRTVHKNLADNVGNFATDAGTVAVETATKVAASPAGNVVGSAIAGGLLGGIPGAIVGGVLAGLSGAEAIVIKDDPVQERKHVQESEPTGAPNAPPPTPQPGSTGERNEGIPNNNSGEPSKSETHTPNPGSHSATGASGLPSAGVETHMHGVRDGVAEEQHVSGANRPQIIQKPGAKPLFDSKTGGSNVNLVQISHASYIKELNKYNTVFN